MRTRHRWLFVLTVLAFTVAGCEQPAQADHQPMADLTPMPLPAKGWYHAVPGFRAYDEPVRVFRLDKGGKVFWSARLAGHLGGWHREPHLLADEKQLYLSHDDGVTALDR